MIHPVKEAPGYIVTRDPENRVIWALCNPDGSVFRRSSGCFYGDTAEDDAYLAAVTHHMVTWTKISQHLHKRS